MNEPSTVTYPTAEILKRIEDKLDRQSEKLNTIEVELAEIKTEVKNLNQDVTQLKGATIELAEIKTEVKNLNQDVTELKGSTKAQIWTLIGILVTAVGGFLVAVARFVFYPIA
ncbi:hemolysin XhlA family protein [Crocosphaera sp.]|uniref:hemolysin XhlA family protein n=1 Tax=Crocosphaera sp. TaxID=2729996 RepID=UPI002610D12B|nr:hemolysin XhlA family protein [Crocosphaera sp.]MDJ0582181.1 hemolysin XhlA family protein [Crocosphaera sp.]